MVIRFVAIAEAILKTGKTKLGGIISKTYIQFFKKGDRHYQVLADGRAVGEVYYDPNAWSDGRWFYIGQVRDRTPSPTRHAKFAEVTAQTQKFRGFRTRALAVETLLK